MSLKTNGIYRNRYFISPRKRLCPILASHCVAFIFELPRKRLCPILASHCVVFIFELPQTKTRGFPQIIINIMDKRGIKMLALKQHTITSVGIITPKTTITP